MLVSIIGSRGSGKTLLLTLIASKSKREVYSNFKVKLKNYKPLKVIDLLELKNDVDVLIDEGYTWLESRTSSSTLNRYLSYIVLQSRKRTIDIYITAQMFSSIDIRFRVQSDVIVKCERNKTDGINDGFCYEFLEIESDKIRKFFLTEEKAKEYYGIFDTYEIVEPHTKEMLEFKLLESNPKALDKKIRQIAKKVRKIIKGDITHDKVRRALRKAGYNAGYEKDIYIELKE